MLQRGRKANLGAVTVLPGDRPSAPEALCEAGKELWERVIRSLPADFLRGADLVLLHAYCEQWAQYQAALGRWLSEEEKGDWDRSQDALKSWVTLSTKLRLTPQARYDAAKASTAAKRMGEKPWRAASGE